jgi:hypothetical protein
MGLGRKRYQLLTRRGRLPPARTASRELLLTLVSRRYERGSIIITSNRGFEA